MAKNEDNKKHEKSNQKLHVWSDHEAQTHHQADDFVFEEQITFVMQGTSEGYDQRNEKHRQDETAQEDGRVKKDPSTTAAQEKILASEDRKRRLPIYAYRDEFLDAVHVHPVLIVVGESGCGKTTQIPQYLHEEIGRCHTSSNRNSELLLGTNSKKKICCTLPCRVATRNAAARVAQEMNVQLGEQVGYSTTRTEHCTSPATVIQYMTDEMFLREILTTQPDAALADYGCIVIDDAHERTLYTDLLLGLLRDIIIRRSRRSDLKLIISGGPTLDVEKVSTFFDDASIFSIPTRTFPVEIYYYTKMTPPAQSDHGVDAAFDTVLQIHVSQPLNGHVLVFLTCREEIDAAAEILSQRSRNLGSHIPKLIICPIDPNLPFEQQQQAKILETTPKGARKVFLATKIAETSLAIDDDICYVIDPGFSKHKAFNALSGMESLVVSPISQATAKQRAARAGRTQPGKCFRLYTEWSFQHELDPKTVPEILRTDMTNVVLMLKSLGVTDVLHFNFMDKPPTDALISALDQLYALGALNERGELTNHGRKMAEFPPETPSENEPSTIPYALLAPLYFASFVDAMSMMLVPASLFFYVIEQGGSYESYGIVLSAFSLSSFSLKLVFGIWSDKTGGKVRKQYLTAFGLATLGGVVYFLASCTNMPGTVAVTLIFLARFLAGCGSAHITLGYTYFARVLTKRLLTRACTMLHFLRAIGIFLSFAINVMLHKINATIHIGPYAVELTPLNNVGFVLFFANALVFAVLAFHLQEPHDAHLKVVDTLKPSTADSVTTLDLERSIRDEFDEVQHVKESSGFDWRSIHCCEIILPIWICFNLFAGFQLIETAMTPALNDALGWGPVGASALYSGMAAIALPGFILTFELSRRGVRDELIVSSGLVVAIVGYTMMYLLWTHAATPLLFCLPLIVVLEFPLVQGPTYSIYSAVIGRKPALKPHQGFMQAIMIMADSVPGLILPSFIATFVLREPQNVVASSHGRELSPLALYAPILSLITLVGVWYVHCGNRQVGRSSSLEANGGEERVKLDETVGLLETVQRS
jgi:Major Facilitator Superfamily/AAA domain/Helicase conserved C-terminal domain/Helicase associated domain (HA2)